jgi:hypothetical protein
MRQAASLPAQERGPHHAPVVRAAPLLASLAAVFQHLFVVLRTYCRT